MYRHTQIGRAALAINAALALLLVALHGRGGGAGPWVGVAVLLLVSVLFGTMTVEVGGGALRFWFGPRGWGRTIPLAEISAAAPARSAWWEGVGIRLTSRGRLYTVAPGSAVEVALRSGARIRVGTDDPDGLLRALSPAQA